ncbi:MAG: hypothetical protein AAF713_14025 [Pseudomonadota bacterium]
MARIKRLGEEVVHLLIRDFTISRRRKLRVRFEKALHFCLGCKALTGIALKGFFQNGGDRFIGHKNFALTADTLESVSDRSLKHPVVVHRTSTHAIAGLLAVLLTLVLGHARKKIFDQLAVTILAEFQSRRFEKTTRLADCSAKLKVWLDTAR